MTGHCMQPPAEQEGPISMTHKIETEETPSSSADQSLKILIVDDIEAIRSSILNYLLSFGVLRDNIVLCASGREAEGFLMRNPFDLIILGLMDKGHGLTLMRWLMEKDYMASLIIMSFLEQELIDLNHQLTQIETHKLTILGTLNKPLCKTQLKLLIEKNASRQQILQRLPSISHKDDIKNEALEKILCNSIHTDISNSAFNMYYQPKVSTRTGLITGYEALARLSSMEYGIVPPDLFIPILDGKNLMALFTNLTIKLCVQDINKIKARLNKEINVAINIPIEVFCLNNFPDLFSELTKTVPSENLTIEITESNKEHSHIDFILNASRVRMMRFGLSMDDFGTEHSNLERLLNIPFTELKIDKMYIQDLMVNPKKFILVTAITDMARKLGLKVVAEGIETDLVAQKLLDMHIHELQGYFYSKPISFDVLVELIQEDKVFDCLTGKKKLHDLEQNNAFKESQRQTGIVTRDKACSVFLA